MPNSRLINSLALATNCSMIHYYQISIIAFINWQHRQNQSPMTAVSHDGHFLFFLIKPFFDVNRRPIQLQQVSWLTLYHSYLLLTRQPAKHSIAFYVSPWDQLKKDMKTVFQIFLLFNWKLCCSPWLFIHRCLEMNTSHYYHTVLACGLCGLLIPVKWLCVYETLNSTMLCSTGQYGFKGHGTDVTTYGWFFIPPFIPKFPFLPYKILTQVSHNHSVTGVDTDLHTAYIAHGVQHIIFLQRCSNDTLRFFGMLGWV